MLGVHLTELEKGVDIVWVPYYIVLSLNRSILFACFESNCVVFSLYIEFLADGKIFANSWREDRLFHHFFEVFLHFLFFFCEIGISSFLFWFPSSEMSSDLSFIVEFPLADFENIGPYLILFFLVIRGIDSKIELSQSLLNFFDLSILIIILLLLIFQFIFVFLLFFLLLPHFFYCFVSLFCHFLNRNLILFTILLICMRNDILKAEKAFTFCLVGFSSSYCYYSTLCWASNCFCFYKRSLALRRLIYISIKTKN